MQLAWRALQGAGSYRRVLASQSIWQKSARWWLLPDKRCRVLVGITVTVSIGSSRIVTVRSHVVMSSGEHVLSKKYLQYII